MDVRRMIAVTLMRSGIAFRYRSGTRARPSYLLESDSWRRSAAKESIDVAFAVRQALRVPDALRDLFEIQILPLNCVSTYR
jgi:hypothetical protein